MQDKEKDSEQEKESDYEMNQSESSDDQDPKDVIATLIMLYNWKEANYYQYQRQNSMLRELKNELKINKPRLFIIKDPERRNQPKQKT